MICPECGCHMSIMMSNNGSGYKCYNCGRYIFIPFSGSVTYNVKHIITYGNNTKIYGLKTQQEICEELTIELFNRR